MNIENIFNFIEEKKGYKTPLTYKIINQLPITNDDLHINGDLNLRFKTLITLPKNLHVSGNLDLYNASIEYLPDNLYVGGYLDLESTYIKKLPDNLHVGTYLDIASTNIQYLPNNLYIGKDLICYFTPLSKNHTRAEIIDMLKDKNPNIHVSL